MFNLTYINIRIFTYKLQRQKSILPTNTVVLNGKPIQTNVYNAFLTRSTKLDSDWFNDLHRQTFGQLAALQNKSAKKMCLRPSFDQFT